MAHLYPTSSQWIAFPTNPKNTVTIEWTEGLGPGKAIYYVTKCYWGQLRNPPSKSNKNSAKDLGDEENDLSPVKDAKASQKPALKAEEKPFDPGPSLKHTGQNNKFNPGQASVKKPRPSRVLKPRALPDQDMDILGETVLYIAAEYVEPQYRGGPLKKFHIKDLALDAIERASKDSAKAVGIETAADAVKLEDPAWITMQLNGCFHYGQNGYIAALGIVDRRRWIVYHPPISAKIPAPKMYQHRFTGLVSTDYALAAANTVSQLAPAQYRPVAAAGSKFMSMTVNAGKSVFGDLLHAFLDDHVVREIDAKARLLNKKATKAAGGVLWVDDPDGKLLVLLQYVENHKATDENKIAKQKATQRAMEEKAYLKQYHKLTKNDQSWEDAIYTQEELDLANEEADDRFASLGISQTVENKIKTLLDSTLDVLGDEVSDAEEEIQVPLTTSSRAQEMGLYRGETEVFDLQHRKSLKTPENERENASEQEKLVHPASNSQNSRRKLTRSVVVPVRDAEEPKKVRGAHDDLLKRQTSDPTNLFGQKANPLLTNNIPTRKLQRIN